MQSTYNNQNKTDTSSKSFSYEKYRSYSTSNNLTDNDSEIEEEEEEEEHEKTWKSRPNVWSDDTRMNALFSPFRKRDLNPLHYDNKLKFWKEQIIAYCNEKEVIQIDLKTLENCFIRQKRKPKCLEPVLSQMVTDGSFQTRNQILRPKIGIIQAVINKCIWSPLAWSTNFILEKTKISSYITSSSSEPNLSDLNSSSLHNESQKSSKYVNVTMIELKSAQLLDILQKKVVFNNVDCLYEYKKIFESGFTQNEQDLEIILKYLEVNQRIIVFDADNNKRYVKFSMSSRSVAPVTEIEHSYIQLKDTEQKLEDDTNKIEAEITSLNEIIKVYLKQNNRTSALKHLKKRKQLEKSLESKDNALSNIQAMLMSIQQADTNKLAYDAYNKSASALKEANKEVNIDKLDDTIQDIQDMIQANNEIEEVMKSPMSGKFNFDDSELNQELAQLMENSKEDGNVRRINLERLEESMDMSDILSNLPKIPESITPKKQASHTY